jgi:hypothetical protein
MREALVAEEKAVTLSWVVLRSSRYYLPIVKEVSSSVGYHQPPGLRALEGAPRYFLPARPALLRRPRLLRDVQEMLPDQRRYL